MRLRYLFASILCMCCMAAVAQDRGPWLVVLKDSTRIQGTVAEVDLKGLVTIVRANGAIEYVAASGIARMERIDRQSLPKEERQRLQRSKKRSLVWDEPPKRGLTTHVLTDIGYGQVAIGAAVGYRFSPWAQLRGGFLCDLTLTSVTFMPTRHNGRQMKQSGVYFPVFAQFGGHRPGRMITPFYDLEVGYAFRAHYFTSEPDFHPVGTGGYHVAATVGARFIQHLRYNFSIGLRVSLRGMDITFREFGHDYDKGLLTIEDHVRTVSALYIGLGMIHSFGR